MNARLWARLTAPIIRRIKLLATRGVVRLIDPATLMQSLQVEALTAEVKDGIEHFEPYGFTSVPLPGAEAVLLSFGGRRAHTIAVVVADRRYRKRNMAAGDVALHNHLGDYILIKNDRTIEVIAATKVKVTAPIVEVVATTKVTFTSPSVEMSGTLSVAGAVTMQDGATVTGTVNVTGTVSATVDVLAAGKSGKLHTHSDPQGGSVGPPI